MNNSPFFNIRWWQYPGIFDPHRSDQQRNRMMALYTGTGTSIQVNAGNKGTRFLHFSGKPLREPVARGSPIVMNTEEELQQAFAEYKTGSLSGKEDE